MQGTGKNEVKGQRSDTVILAHLYGDSDKAQLISFREILGSPFPAHTNQENSKAVPEKASKLNSAIREGGPQLLILTIESFRVCASTATCRSISTASSNW